MRHAISNDIQRTLEAKMPNTANRRNLKALMDLLSDSHSEITTDAAEVNTYLIDADTIAADNGSDASGRADFKRKIADRRLGALLVALSAQACRLTRVVDEVEEIRKNIRVI